MSSTLTGHKETVLCLATTQHTGNQRVISGAEGGEIRLWSLDGSGVQQVTCSSTNDVTSLCCSTSNPDVFYAAVAENICVYDCRKLLEPTHVFQFNEEEINQITLNRKESYLATADDTGHVKIVDVVEKKLYKTLRKHTNISSSVTFHPQRQWDLFTGGYDSKLIQWDYSRSRATCVVDMSEVGTVDEPEGPYLLNPPFIHSVAISASGGLLACGTENALIQVFSVSKRGLELVGTLRGHTQGVSQVYFPESDDNVLVSGGNDGMVHFWDAHSISSRPVVCNGHGPSPPPTGADQVASGDSSAENSCSKFATIDHGNKINWVTGGCRDGNKFMVIADNTPNLTLYPFPY